MPENRVLRKTGIVHGYQVPKGRSVLVYNDDYPSGGKVAVYPQWVLRDPGNTDDMWIEEDEYIKANYIVEDLVLDEGVDETEPVPKRSPRKVSATKYLAKGAPIRDGRDELFEDSSDRQELERRVEITAEAYWQAKEDLGMRKLKDGDERCIAPEVLLRGGLLVRNPHRCSSFEREVIYLKDEKLIGMQENDLRRLEEEILAAVAITRPGWIVPGLRKYLKIRQQREEKTNV